MSSDTSTARPEAVPLCEPFLAGNEWAYVKDCLDSGWLSSAGPWVDRFEAAFAETVGAPRAVATVNGTAALHVALRLVGVARDDEVLVSDLTFIAPANAIRYLGAWPVLVDADLGSWQMDPGLVERFLEEGCERIGQEVRNRRTGRRVKALLPVHILGHPVEMEQLLQLAGRFGLPVVEDATESLGATYRGDPLGTLGTVGCFSFNGNKLMTTGAGGMLVTRDPALADRARYLTTQAKDDPVEYVHHTVGYNYRLSNLQAAVGCAQLERLDDFVGRKREIAARYIRELADLPGITPLREAEPGSGAYWLSAIRVDTEAYGRSSRELMVALRELGIQTRPLWTPLHQNPAMEGAIRCGSLQSAERLHREVLTLPSSVGITQAQQDRVIDAIKVL